MSSTIFRRIWIVVYGLLAAIAAVVLLPIAAFVLALVFVWINHVAHWVELGETQAWLGIIFALYAMYAGIVVGPLVWWRVSANRLNLTRKANNFGTLAVFAVFAFVALWVVLGEQGITASTHLEAVSDDGKFVLASLTRSDSAALYKIDASNGHASPLTSIPAGYVYDADFSPDGKQIVFSHSTNEKNHTLMITDLEGKSAHALLPDGGNDSWPRFSRDGNTIYFVRTADPCCGHYDLFAASLDGKTVSQLTHQSFDLSFRSAPVLSSDGKRVLFTAEDSLSLFSVSGSTQRPDDLAFFLPNALSPRMYQSAHFSSDDKGVVFMAATEGKDGYEYNVYIVDLASRQVKKLTNHGYASDFRVSGDSSKAVFLTWKFSRFQKLPRSFQMQLMDLRNGTVAPVHIDMPKQP